MSIFVSSRRAHLISKMQSPIKIAPFLCLQVMEMQIKRTIEKIPGGMMLVPLFLGALCHTFSPGAGKYFGSFTNGMITGTVPILAVWFFCMGAGSFSRWSAGRYRASASADRPRPPGRSTSGSGRRTATAPPKHFHISIECRLARPTR